MKDYLILITEESKPVLVDISDNSKHIPISRVYGHLPFITGDMAGWYKNNVGQTFPLPTGYKVSFEKKIFTDGGWQYVQYDIDFDNHQGLKRKLAILSKLEEDGTNVIKIIGELNAEIVKRKVVAPSEEVNYTYVVFKKSVMNMYELESDAQKLADELNKRNVDPDENYVVEKVKF